MAKAPAAPLTPAIPNLPATEAEPATASPPQSYCPAWLVNVGWLNTTLALSIYSLPFNFLLKDGLRLNAEKLALFMLLAGMASYLKPFAGILSDALPLCGTRRRHYVVFGLLASGVLWLLLAVVPRTFNSLLATMILLNISLTLVSTVLGGLMVEVGKQQNETGKLGSQRHGITHFSGIIGSLLGGPLTRLPFLIPASLCALAYASAAPIFWRYLKEPGGQKPDAGPLREVRRQGRIIKRSGTLWSAAGLIVLVVAAPGFGTPLFFHQTNVLKFSPEFLSILSVVGGSCAALAALVYGKLCRKFGLRTILSASIVLHGVLTLLYLLYKSQTSALIITGIEGATMSLAILPLYDLAARATPRGSEALGFCIILSVWNLTTMLSNYAGSWLYSTLGFTFANLVWLNAATTLLVLVAVPFLPRVLTDRRDGDPTAGGVEAPAH
jgi:predicted MFS family arabinose efflux permease